MRKEDRLQSSRWRERDGDARSQANQMHFPVSLRRTIEQFVNEKNVDHFRKRLAETTDKSDCRMILKLLAEEKEKSFRVRTGLASVGQPQDGKHRRPAGRSNGS